LLGRPASSLSFSPLALLHLSIVVSLDAPLPIPEIPSLDSVPGPRRILGLDPAHVPNNPGYPGDSSQSCQRLPTHIYPKPIRLITITSLPNQQPSFRTLTTRIAAGRHGHQRKNRDRPEGTPLPLRTGSRRRSQIGLWSDQRIPALGSQFQRGPGARLQRSARPRRRRLDTPSTRCRKGHPESHSL